MSAAAVTGATKLQRLSRVLFIEDEADIRHVAKLALERAGGLEVLACKSGEEALRSATQFLPDLVLLDVMMPEMDGPETLMKLRLLPGLELTPVIFMTAKVQPGEIAHLKSLGALEVIAKPFDPMRLASQLMEIWSSAPVSPSSSHTRHDGLEELRKQYAQSFDERWRRLNAAWALTKEGDMEALQRVRLQAHTMAGSGATIGFPEVSRLASEVEHLLALRDETSKDIDNSSELDTLISQLRLATATSDEVSERLAYPRRANGTIEERKLIYLFDDDAELARALQLQLQLFGFDVETFATSDLLESALFACRPAVVVMDIMFQEGELAGPGAIIASETMRRHTVPVIFMSGRGDLAARLEAVRAGGSDYLTKPVRVANLVERLDRLTDGFVEESFRVIVYHAEAGSAERLAGILRKAGLQVFVALDKAQIPVLLSEVNADLVLMNSNLPGCTSVEMIGVIHQIDRCAILPVVLLAETRDEVTHQDANAVLFEPYSADELIAVVTAWCKRYSAQRALMTMDGLTGLANHTLILRQLELETSRASRHQHALAVAMIDVDHFKRLNDAEGHAIGDRVLASLGRFLRQRLRKTDFVGRYGGEEFMVLLPETSGRASMERLDTLRREFSAIRHSGAKNVFSITFSVGIACFPEIHGAVNLATAADRALYDAKGTGRNCVVLTTEIAEVAK